MPFNCKPQGETAATTMIGNLLHWASGVIVGVYRIESAGPSLRAGFRRFVTSTNSCLTWKSG
jgi:hypothetical protein